MLINKIIYTLFFTSIEFPTILLIVCQQLYEGISWATKHSKLLILGSGRTAGYTAAVYAARKFTAST